MGHGLKHISDDLEKALALPPGSVSSVGELSKPNPRVKLQLGQRMIACGVARGLSAPEVD